MKRIATLILSSAVIGVLALTVSSCKKEEVPAPTVSIFFSVDGYQVAFTATVTNATSFAWDFGDGETSTEQNPTHVYAQSGTYDVSLTVKGDGGEATETAQVTIAASKEEMLTGGPAMANGKSWQFSPAAGTDDGIYYADADFTFQDPIPSGILGLIGLQDEYNDEFVFHSDGSYTHVTANDSVVTDAIFAMVNQLPFRQSGEDAIVLCPFTPEAATFTLTENTDLTLDVTSDTYPDSTWSVTWSGVDIIEISGTKEFIGVQDFTRKYIVFDIGTDHMQLGVFISATSGSKLNYPSHLLRMTFVPKQ